jgi:capsular exopolysaccharide synthesis family protein
MHQNLINTPGNEAVAGDAGQGLMRSINLRDLWAPLYRSRYAVIAIFVAMFSLAIAATLLIQPRYRAVTTVEIRSETQKVLGTEDTDQTAAASASDASKFLDTQLDIIKSRSTTAAVAQSLGLYNNDNFLEAMGVDADGIKTGILNPQEARRKLIDQTLLDNLQVEFSNDTRIAEIKFTSPDPRLAQRIVNSYADNYIRLNLARRFDASSYSLDFLRNQIREAQQRLAESERKAIAYARRERLIDASNAATGSTLESGPQSLTTASLVGLNQALSDVTAKRIAAEQRWRVANAAKLLTIPEVVANPAVQQLQQQRAILQSQYQQELETRREDHPTVRQLAARVEELKQQTALLAGNVKSTIREEYEAARAQEDGLRSMLDRLKSTTLDEQGRSIQLSILRREATTNRLQLDALLKRYNELNAQSGVQLNNLSVIDRAEVPSGAYWPSVPLNVALALVLSILLSGIYVLGRENLFEMVRTPEDVGTRLRQPVLGAVPAEENVIALMTDPKSNVSEALNSIRTSLSLTSATGIPRSLMLTSTQAGEGKSTTCYGLAQGLAKLGRSVIVIDADLRKPNVHRLYGLRNEAGVSNILSGSGELEEYIHHGIAPNIDVIVAGPIPPDASELLGRGRLRSLVGELAARYDHVLVDSAPVLGLADAPLVASCVDGIIYVIESARNSVRGVQTALTRLQQGGTPILGVVLSRFHPGESGYSYEYRYAYEYSYGADKNKG